MPECQPDELHRLITSMGVACEVIAPSLVPEGALQEALDAYRGAHSGRRAHTRRGQPIMQ